MDQEITPHLTKEKWYVGTVYSMLYFTLVPSIEVMKFHIFISKDALRIVRKRKS